jgi:hypothetical protein
MDWTTIHMDHQGNSIGEISPANLEWSKRLNQIGTITYDIPLSSRMARLEKTHPYVTDFMLYKDDDMFLGGLHTGIQKNIGDQEIQVAGKDWGHYFENRIFPFDPSDPAANFYAVVQQNIVAVARYLIEYTMNDSPYSLIVAVDQTSVSSHLTNYSVEPADQDTIYSKISSLSDQKDGFDFEFTPDKQLLFYVPIKGSTIDYVLEVGKNVADIEYNIEEARANWILGMGAGTGTPLAKLSQDIPNQVEARRIDKAVNFGDDVIDKTTLQRYADAEIDREQTIPHITGAEIVASKVEEVLDRVDVGDIVTVVAEDEYDSVTELVRVIGMTGGEETLSLEFANASH